MLTTIGDWALAIVRKVSASRDPLIGALFTVGSASVCADEPGGRSKREASTIATANDATALSRT